MTRRDGNSAPGQNAIRVGNYGSELYRRRMIYMIPQVLWKNQTPSDRGTGDFT